MRDRRKGDCLLNVVSFIVSFVIFQLVFLALIQRLKIKTLESDKERIERSRDRWEHNYWKLAQDVSKEMENRKYNANTFVSKNTIRAVKYAMKYAHPDNGRNAEDFIKFKKCYEESTRK